MKTKIGTVFLIIAILIICCVLPSVTSEEISKNEKDSSSSQKIAKIDYLRNCYARGNASSGRILNGTKIGIIKFDYVWFDKLHFFPIRWEGADYYDATALVFGIDQEIPEGPFEFERDWVRAIVFY